MTGIIAWIQANWVPLVALLWTVEKLFELLGTLTGNKMIDNVGIWLGTVLKQFFPKQQ